MTQHTDVAGPSGYGPKVTVRPVVAPTARRAIRKASQFRVTAGITYCEHPSLPERKYIGDNRWDTPGWCPAAAPTPALARKARGDCAQC